ncbi:unnamed protein product [Plutella xylostella]|uniref:(diamondback moth) hypothetical protein n=1 Tax=Plutella xylostella TaxID=51655 RepID=A0A8S4EA63_PLUXY|nr:unnamed protein product [Plutella xylostella]
MQTYRHLLVFSMCVIKCSTDSAAHDIHSVIKIGKKNHLIECSLGNIVKICVTNALKNLHQNYEYYLNTPSGENIKLDDKMYNYYCNHEHSVFTNELTDEYNNENIQIDVIDSYNDEDALEREKSQKTEDKNTINIGPLRAQDHGNWMISKYYRNERNELVEEYQTISIIIIEKIPSQPQFMTLQTGDDFHLSFPYSLPNLETCQLLSKTADRYYERDQNRLNLCGYVVKSVTKEDIGLWEIKASGDIEYATSVYLDVSG